MKLRFSLILATLSVLVAGCATAPQKPIQLAQKAPNEQPARIGVVMTKLPKIDIQYPVRAVCYALLRPL